MYPPTHLQKGIVVYSNNLDFPLPVRMFFAMFVLNWLSGFKEVAADV